MKEKTDIRKCIESDVSGTGRFYDSVVLWLNDHINYPRWIYRVYPGEQSVRAMTEAGTLNICVKGCSVKGAFVLIDDPQGNYQKGEWSRKLVDGSYMVIHVLAVDPTMQRKGMGMQRLFGSVLRKQKQRDIKQCALTLFRQTNHREERVQIYRRC